VLSRRVIGTFHAAERLLLEICTLEHAMGVLTLANATKIRLCKRSVEIHEVACMPEALSQQCL